MERVTGLTAIGDGETFELDTRRCDETVHLLAPGDTRGGN
jgi:hypothetical protein